MVFLKIYWWFHLKHLILNCTNFSSTFMIFEILTYLAENFRLNTTMSRVLWNYDEYFDYFLPETRWIVRFEIITLPRRYGTGTGVWYFAPGGMALVLVLKFFLKFKNFAWFGSGNGIGTQPCPKLSTENHVSHFCIFFILYLF